MSDESTTTDNGVDYASMHWKQLKQLMEAEGQEFTNSADAVAYLTALDAESSPDEEASGDIGTEPVEEPEKEAPPATQDDTEASDLDPAGNFVNEPEQQTEPSVTQPDAENEPDDVVTADDLVDTPEDGIPPFNPDEPYGEVNGISNARYWQNGMHYTGQGEPILPEDVE